MSDFLIPLISGFVIAFTGIGIGFYGICADKSGKLIFPTMGILCVTGVIIAGIGMAEEGNDEQAKQQAIKNQIESMSCSQLHDALLHNTINGTDHIQRATERYVAGCETK